MIVKENIEISGKSFVKQYSGSGFYIERDGGKYSEAIDPAEFGRIYTETDKPVEGEGASDIVQKAEAFDYLTGRSDGDE